MTTVSTATTSPETCDVAPAEPFTAVFDRLPLTTIPLDEPGAEVGGAEAEQLAVGVDLVVGAGGVGLGRAEALGEADEHDPGRSRRRRRGSRRSRARRAARSTAARCRCGRRSRRPWSSRSKSFTATTPKSDGDERAGHDRRDAPQAEHDRRARPAPTTSVRPCVSPRWRDHAPQLLEEVALDLLDAEQLRHLADDDRQREADDEALEHRLGDEVGEEAEAQQAGRERDDAGDDRQHRR